MADTTPQTTQTTESPVESTENKPTSAEGSKVDQNKGLTTVVSQPSKSLFVTDLSPDVTESTLLEVFSKVGPTSIASIRVCRDNQNRSLGYAYVNFNSAEQCENALDVLNFEPILGRPCRISKSIRDPSIRKSGVGNLFVKNLAKDIDHAGLYDVFSSFGEIISCKVATDSTGESKGYGFVHFALPQDAEAAIDTLNGKCLNDKQVYVGKFIPRSSRAPTSSGSKNRFTNIYLKHLNPNLTQETFLENLTKATSEFGKITSAKLVTTIVSVERDGQIVNEEVSKGFGFSNFENHDVAAKALERFKDEEKMRELAPTLLADGQPLYANVAMTKEERRQQMKPENRNLYVKNIAENVTDEQFRELFENGREGKENPEKKIGKITSACIMKDDSTGAHKGFGFACYETKEAATQAIQELNGYLLEGKPLYVALAQPIEERRRQLAVQFSRPPMGGPMGMYPPFGYPPMGVPRGYPPQQRVPAPAGFPRRMHPQGNFPNPSQPRTPVPSAPGRIPFVHPQYEFFMDLFKGFPENEVNNRLGDMLYSLFNGDGHDAFTAKSAVSHVLSTGQGKNLAQTVEYVLCLNNSQAARNALIQQIKNPRQ